MTTLQEQKKLILPFLQARASEIARAEPKIAYYCRLYAVSQAVGLGVGTLVPEIRDLLTTLLASLEHDKKTLDLGPDDALLCETFALTVFGRADRSDRAGQADRNTALTYYASSIFMEIVNQFGELAPETLTKQRFAAWRAADIRKALSEGRTPNPPPSADMPSVSAEDEELLATLSSMPSVGAAGPTLQSGGSCEVPGVGTEGNTLAGVGTPLPPPAARDEPAGPSGGLPPPPHASAPQFIPPGAEGEADEGETDDGGLRLPSPPLSPPMGSGEVGGLHRRVSGVVWTPPPPRAFYTFQKVLFWPEGAPAPAKGTVARVNPAKSAAAPATYFVALAGSIEACGAESLVPDLSTGEDVLLHTPGGDVVDATVAEVDSSQWPPTYLVRAANGAYTTTTIERIEALGTAPHVPAATSAPALVRPGPATGFEPSLQAITDAQKLTKTATSALAFEDVRTAVKYLNDALRLLTQP